MPANTINEIKPILEPIWNAVWGAVSDAVLSAFPLLHILLIIAAAYFGVMLYPHIKSRTREILSQALGGFVLMLGVLEGFLSLNADTEAEQLEPVGSILILVALAIGFLLGEAIQLEVLLGKLGKLLHEFLWPSKATPKKDERRHAIKDTPALPASRQYDATSFIAATLICGFSGSTVQCALVAQGAGNAAPLAVKLLTDAALIFALAMLCGVSAGFAAVPALVVDGGLLLLAKNLGDKLPATLPPQLQVIGASILILLGLGLMLGKKLRASHLVPALLIPPLYEIILAISEKAGQ